MAGTKPRKIPVVFYRTRGGVEVVRDWLRGLEETGTPSVRTSCGSSIAGLSGMPLCRSLGQGLWEVRSDLPSNRIARVLFSVEQGHIVALHGFIKKTRKTPDEDLALARKRKKEFAS